jgi:putative glycoprotease GCP
VRILAIESSCDEFSMAIVEDGRNCLVMETLTQIDIHAKFGGVIPELASREHAKYFTFVLDKIKTFIENDWAKVDAFAVTIGPGLSGSLLVGIQVAKVLATILNKPLIPVHHILGHLLSPQLSTEICYPYLSLVVSGGHTELLYCFDETSCEILGSTRDDAVGEVYDKVAKKLGLEYPGGPQIDKLAQSGKCTYQFKKPELDEKFAFSFSGLKSAVINTINSANMKKEAISLPDIAMSFQTIVVEELLGKLTLALDSYSVAMVGLCGGVSANQQLRASFVNLQEKYSGVKFVMPELKYCGDNAAMIGCAAFHVNHINASEIPILECAPNLTLEKFFEEYEMKK